MTITCNLGVWEDNAQRVIPQGSLEWRSIPRRVYTASVGGKPLATIRRALYQKVWIASMPGFLWDVQGERGSSTTNFLKIKTSPVRGFPSSAEARSAVEEAYRALFGDPQ